MQTEPGPLAAHGRVCGIIAFSSPQLVASACWPQTCSRASATPEGMRPGASEPPLAPPAGVHRGAASRPSRRTPRSPWRQRTGGTAADAAADAAPPPVTLFSLYFTWFKHHAIPTLVVSYYLSNRTTMRVSSLCCLSLRPTLTMSCFCHPDALSLRGGCAPHFPFVPCCRGGDPAPRGGAGLGRSGRQPCALDLFPPAGSGLGRCCLTVS